MAAATTSSYPDARITATDVDPVMVQAARQRLRDRANLCVEQADVTDLPYMMIRWTTWPAT